MPGQPSQPASARTPPLLRPTTTRKPHTSEAAHEPAGSPNARGSHLTSGFYRLHEHRILSHPQSRYRRKRQLIRSKRSKSPGAPAQTAVTVGELSGTEVPVTVLAGRSTGSPVTMMGPKE